MRLVREALRAVPAALPEVHADRERGGAGGDVHGRAAREVEPAHDERPAIRVPGPARDRVVHDRRPDEDEDHGRTEARALRDGAEREHRGDGGEHELEDAEGEGGDARAANGGLVEDALEAEIFCGRVGVSAGFYC